MPIRALAAILLLLLLRLGALFFVRGAGTSVCMVQRRVRVGTRVDPLVFLLREMEQEPGSHVEPVIRSPLAEVVLLALVIRVFRSPREPVGEVATGMQERGAQPDRFVMRTAWRK